MAAPTAAEPQSASIEGEHFWPDVVAFIDLSPVQQVSTGAARCTALAICDASGKPARIFRQGETASFFYEFQALADLAVPIGGLTLRNDRGAVVHGKNSLQHDSIVPSFVPSGTRLRFRQDVSLELCPGEYTLEVGLASLGHDDFQHRHELPYEELNARTARLCHLPHAAHFAITLAGEHRSTLLHHGIANLPGDCRLMVLNPERSTSEP